MDRVLSSKEQSKNKIKNIWPIILIIALLILSYLGVKKILQKEANSNDFHIVKVERGTIKSTLSATGIVVAASERVINAPVSTEIEEVLLFNGAKVNPGDLILKLDEEYTKLEYERLQDELSLRKNNIQKLKLEFDKDLIDLDYQDQIKALQLDELKAQLGDQERLLNIGGATKEEVEAAKLQLNIAEIEKKMLENELQFKRQVNSTDKNNLQLEYDIQAKRLVELKSKLSETYVKAPQKGVITWVNEDIGKTVSQGEPLVKIANLNRFKVEASTSDRNSKELQVGLPVELRIGKDRLKGQVTRISPEILNNTVKFYVSLEKDDHESLRPNLRAEIYVITNEKENVLKAKRGNALTGSQSQFFYRVVNNEAIKTRVKKGLTSADYFEIDEGLNEGDQIIISETKEFDHMDKFIIKEK